MSLIRRTGILVIIAVLLVSCSSSNKEGKGSPANPKIKPEKISPADTKAEQKKVSPADTRTKQKLKTLCDETIRAQTNGKNRQCKLKGYE